MAPSSRASALLEARAPKRFGCEVPRIFTPPLRELTPETSLGFGAIEFADDVIGISLFPWQKWLLIHMLELLPDDSLRFRTVVVLVARQNGKSTLSIVLSLYFMYVLARGLVIGTAQDLDVAEEIWQGAVDLIEEVPALLEQHEHTHKVNGKKYVELKTGERYKVKAANRRAGRGLSGDLILLDELREHQSWDAWGAITKTTMARAFALILALSNAGDATSIVLRHLRKMAHLAIGDPDGINANDDPEAGLADLPDDIDTETDDTLGIFEWSAEPGCDKRDRDGWAQANPSLGHSITEKTIASACSTDPEWVFRTEVLCQWTDGSLEGPFPSGKWEDCLDVTSQIAPGSPIVACVDVSWNRSTSYIAFAGRRADGRIHVEIVAARAGTDWVTDWLKLRVQTAGLTAVALQAKGAPVSSLLDEFVFAELPVIEWGGADLAGAAGTFYDLVDTEELRHLTQPILDVAAATASTRPLADGAWVWDRKKSATDIAALVAATGAVWLIKPKAEEPKKTPRVHEWPDENDDEWEVDAT